MLDILATFGQFTYSEKSAQCLLLYLMQYKKKCFGCESPRRDVT